MALIHGKHIARSYGAEDIFSGVDVSIPHRARIALVGPNGSGKTSLLRILAGEDTPDTGDITRAKDLDIGYLPQEAERTLHQTGILWEAMLGAFDDLRHMEARLSEMEQHMAANPDDMALVETYGELQHRFEEAGGYTYEARIRQVLAGLGFPEEVHQQPIEHLSGGQKTRALLARLLLESPDLLILDEPTNHLDINAIEWLEKWLRDFDGALLVVSHDRMFMDRVVDTVWELIFGRMEQYRGSYSHYMRQREERHEYLLKEYERQQEFIAKEQEYIRRNIAGQNTRQAQGRRKRLERFLAEEAINRPQEKDTMSLHLQTDLRSGDEVLKTHDLHVGYSTNPLFEVPDIILYRGECAALIGPNGAGKSTFLKTVLGKLAPLDGKARIGANVHIGYFAQAHEELTPGNTILEELLEAQPEFTIEEARSYLGRFLFSGDDAYKQIRALSGGERGRVALAKLSLSGANFLLLDEPTNHLDIESQELIEEVLADYAGTIVLVSHDRYLIKELATQIWAIEPEAEQMVVHKGSYDDYAARREAAAQRQKTEPVDTASNGGQPTPTKKKHRSGLNPYQRQKRIEAVEAEIHHLEEEMERITTELNTASESGDVGRVAELGRAYSQAEDDLAALMDEWEMLLEEE